MRIFNDLESFQISILPIALTIGNFDGMHLGHQRIIRHLTDLAADTKIFSCLITFTNHPSTILRPNHSTPLITSYNHKLMLLENSGVNMVFSLEFTKEFAEQTAEDFLLKVKKVLPFRYLILGHDAKIGKDQQGNSAYLHNFANQHHFHLQFLPAVKIAEETVCSSLIRKAIQTHDLKKAEMFLGRKYSIVGKMINSTMDLKGLCYPPIGDYAVTIKTKSHAYEALAHLKREPTPLLELNSIHLEDQVVEVIF